MKKLLGTMVAIMVAAILIGTFITARPSMAGEKARDGRFIAYDNATVMDTKTGLMWAEKDNGSDIDWSGAKRHCENYRGGEYTDWRLPTTDELAGLYESKLQLTRFRERGPSRQVACDKSNNIHIATKLIDITCYTPWASETRVSEAAFFDFTNGQIYWVPQAATKFGRALPVRSGK
jgi:hypothetical protein